MNEQDRKIDIARSNFIKSAAMHFDDSVKMAKELGLDSCDLSVSTRVDLKTEPVITGEDIMRLMLEGRFSKMDKTMLHGFAGVTGQGYYAEHEDRLIIADLTEGTLDIEVYEDGAIAQGPLQACWISVEEMTVELAELNPRP